MSEQAADCPRRMVGEFPQSGEAWRLRTVALYEQGDPGAIAAFDKFVQYADVQESSHEEMHSEARAWKAQLQADDPGSS